MAETYLTDLNIQIIYGRHHNPKAQEQIEKMNQTLKDSMQKKLYVTGTKRWICFYIDVILAYNRTIHISLLDSTPPSSCLDSSACRPANTIENLNAPAILEGNRLILLHSMLDSVTAVEQERPRSAILAVQKIFERMPRNSWSAFLANNQLLFIDDLKLFAEDVQKVEGMTNWKNKNNSAPNVQCGGDTATPLEEIGVYKHLGNIEDSRGVPTIKSFEEVQTKLKARVERLYCTRLNARNLFQAIKKNSISLLNYHIDSVSLNVILGAEMHKQPTPPLKQVDNEEEDLKSENRKHILPLILHGITTEKEPKTNTNEELELDEEIEVVEIVEKIILKRKICFFF
ncbi:hypothetical protein CWI39_0214p0010 [Hamiltosporidium magnivora]|uniref:Integrase catalytic domain-containing protein n=1 Tax=Hamiltosporidium magnivora TaxID=148818 RepID=A0A4Q9LJ17_9MICR|nr:hypothetical protein CWI39_0214p0010 [Hamiltosporidium magnivora]